MNVPAIFFGSVIATICGLLFHLFRGGRTSRLMLYVTTAWVSFFVGQLVSEWIPWRVLRFGSLNLLPDLIATGIGLLTAEILAGPERDPNSQRRGLKHRRRRTVPHPDNGLRRPLRAEPDPDAPDASPQLRHIQFLQLRRPPQRDVVHAWLDRVPHAQSQRWFRDSGRGQRAVDALVGEQRTAGELLSAHQLLGCAPLLQDGRLVGGSF